MKKALGILMALALILCMIPAMAEYDKHIEFSATYVDRGSTAIDDMYKFFCEKYNIDIEMIPIAWSEMANTNSVMIMGGTMYDWMMITWNYNTFLSYVNQGLIKPFPENFEEKYPNIVHALEASGIKDYLYVDGVAYGAPMPIYFNFSPRSYALQMMTCFYRADWARDLGFTWGDSVPLSEFEAYLAACVENDKAGNGQTLGLTCAPGYVPMIYVNQYNEAYNTFKAVDGSYVWGPTLEGTTEGIRNAKKAYQAGLIDPDYFTLDAFSAQNKLAAGLAAATYNTGTSTNYRIILDAATTAGMANAEENIKQIMITDDKGQWHGAQVNNFWCINVFRPDLDDETFGRILDLMDYLYSQEAEEVINMGIKGVDWTTDENGDYVSMLPAEFSNIRQKYPSGWFWRDTTICLDEFDLVNPTYSKAVLDSVNAMYNFRYNSAEQFGYQARDTKVAYLATDSMNNYSVDIDAEITRLVSDSTISLEDVDAEWQNFIKANEGIWQPVVNDLNAQ